MNGYEKRVVCRQRADRHCRTALLATGHQFNGPPRRLDQPPARSLLILQEDPAEYQVERQDPLAVWIEYYHHLSESEREKVLAFLMREGIDGLLTRIAAKD